MTTYSTSLKLSLIGDGEQSGVWGQTTNTNLGTLLEEAITGVVAITMADATYTLTNYNGVSDEARNAVLVVGGTNAAQRNVIIPSVEKLYVVKNATVGGYGIQVKTSGGTGVVIPNGVSTAIYCDGTDCYEQQTGTIGNFAITGNATVGGTLNVTGATTLSTALPVASGGTGATTAANARTNLGLGTIATQAASNVAITGGSITGITDLAIADGGTGASTANAALNNLLPTQTGNNGKYLKSDGTDSSWDAIDISTSDISGTLAVANGGTGSATAGGARTNLGLGTIATQNANSVSITGGSITGITDLAVADGGTGASTAADARTNLGLGTIATQNANNVSITGGSVTGITDLAVADGGTGASTAADARTNLGVPSTTGSGASGTWGISISGNAATATSATSATSATTATSLSTASGAAPSYSARAWVNFNGTGTVAIRASGNVSSITDNGVGDYTVNFTTAMPDANYAVTGSGMRNIDSGGSSQICSVARNTVYSSSFQTTSIRVVFDNGSDDPEDPLAACVCIFR